MAKKKQEVTPPAISTIPLADQDSPLVIDLPDGQKLVVGNIAHGTVIEVATWRGTGRPDSRTSRLMLGVSSTNSVDSASAPTTESEEVQTKKQNPIQKFISSLLASTPKSKRNKEVEAIDELLSESVPTPTASNEKKKSSRVSQALDDDHDIQAWLDQLMSGSDIESLGDVTPAPSSATFKPDSRVKRISSTRTAKKARKGSKRTNSAHKSSSPKRKSSKRGSKTSKTR